MNTLLKITFTITMAVLGTNPALAQFGNKKVVGNGNVSTITVNTAEYSAISTVGSMDVHLESGTEGKIRVTTDENLQDYIIIKVKDNNTLVIKTKKNVSLKTKKGIHIAIPFVDISKVTLVGSGDMDTKDPIKTDEFEVELTGSGDIDIAVNANEIDAKLTGSGDMVLSGSVTDFEVKISGSGDFDGTSLNSENTQAYVSGSGDAKVTAKSSIKARVHGSGNIDYTGNPETSDTKVSGSGSIKSN